MEPEVGSLKRLIFTSLSLSLSRKKKEREQKNHLKEEEDIAVGDAVIEKL